MWFDGGKEQHLHLSTTITRCVPTWGINKERHLCSRSFGCSEHHLGSRYVSENSSEFFSIWGSIKTVEQKARLPYVLFHFTWVECGEGLLITNDSYRYGSKPSGFSWPTPTVCLLWFELILGCNFQWVQIRDKYNNGASWSQLKLRFKLSWLVIKDRGKTIPKSDSLNSKEVCMGITMCYSDIIGSLIYTLCSGQTSST